jgi:1-deoxy-D-xylulose-5-phosphate reductoisomerase
VTNKNIDLLEKQISEFKPDSVVIYDQEAYKRIKDRNNFTNIQIWFNGEGIDRVFRESKPDLFVNAFVGFAGLEPTIKAIESKINVALANKETLVVAGLLITDLVKKNNIDLIPIDSEHSAIMQCLSGEEENEIKRLIITASGGPFRKMKKEDLALVSPEAALKHPNWEMGPKITIDSATLMNKGLEVIEAYWLYKVPVSSIEVVIHPQSIIHSMVEFKDNSIKAQLGLPDMRIPIQC